MSLNHKARAETVTDRKQVIIRVEPEAYKKFKIISERKRRPVGMQLVYLIEKFIENYEAEHGVINADIKDDTHESEQSAQATPA